MTTKSAQRHLLCLARQLTFHHRRQSTGFCRLPQLIRFSGCKGGEACTVVLRGASQYILDEAERSLHDALCVVAQTLKACAGGGGVESYGSFFKWLNSAHTSASLKPTHGSLCVEMFMRLWGYVRGVLIHHQTVLLFARPLRECGKIKLRYGSLPPSSPSNGIHSHRHNEFLFWPNDGLRQKKGAPDPRGDNSSNQKV